MTQLQTKDGGLVNEEDSEEDEQPEMTTVELAGVFVVYIMVGALATAYMSKGDYIDGLYINFRAITADFVEIVPNKCVPLDDIPAVGCSCPWRSFTSPSA